MKYLCNTSYLLIIKFCSSTFRGPYKRYIIKVISELVDINPVVPTIRDPFVDAGRWVGEIQLASYGSMVRNEISNTNIADKI